MFYYILSLCILVYRLYEDRFQIYVPIPVLFFPLDLYIQLLAWKFIWISEKYLKPLPQTHLALKLGHLSKYSSSFQVENIKHHLDISLLFTFQFQFP